MKTRCPSCGATASLDVLMGHEAASTALDNALKLSGKLRRPLVSYLSLFRPGTRELSFDRVSTLLTEIQPDIERGMITRDRADHPAPLEAWLWAIEQTLAARDSGKLALPLKSHGFLYAIITQFKPAQYSAAHSDFAKQNAPVSSPAIQLTAAQQALEEQIKATKNRLSKEK